MAQPDRIPCDVWIITFPNFEKFNQDQKEALLKSIVELKDFVNDPPRGIIGTVRHGNSIAGFYIEEGRRRGLHGDSPNNLAPSQDSNFEKLFFALLLDRGYVVLQDTKLVNYVDLNYPTMRTDFVELLTLLLNRSGIPTARVTWEKYYNRRSQEEMRQLFFSDTASEIDIVDLRGQVVPETIQLSNPDPGEELLLKRIYNREFETIDQEQIKAGPNGDLRKTKSGKAAVGAGTIRKLVSISPSGVPETFYEEQDENIDVPVDTGKQHITTPEIQDMIQIIERRIILPAKLLSGNRKLSDFGPLFGNMDATHE